MRCTDFLHLYSDLRDGIVPDRGVLAELERHLESCPRCARYDHAIAHGVGALRLLSEIEPTAAFQRQLQARLAGTAQELPAAPPMRTPAAVAAAVLLAVACGLLLYEGTAGRQEGAVADRERAIPVVVVNPGVPFVTFTAPEVMARPVLAMPPSAPRLDSGWGTVAP
jgi:anti-sigma factor RsiW